MLFYTLDGRRDESNYPHVYKQFWSGFEVKEDEDV
jgi:hypothetical protein